MTRLVAVRFESLADFVAVPHALSLTPAEFTLMDEPKRAFEHLQAAERIFDQDTCAVGAINYVASGTRQDIIRR
jgi:hypothetical protein